MVETTFFGLTKSDLATVRAIAMFWAMSTTSRFASTQLFELDKILSNSAHPNVIGEYSVIEVLNTSRIKFTKGQ